MKQCQIHKVLNTEVPVTSKRWCTHASTLFVSAFAMVASLSAQVNDAAFIQYAETNFNDSGYALVTDDLDYAFSLQSGNSGYGNYLHLNNNGWNRDWNSVKNYADSKPNDAVLGMMLANTATMYGSTSGLGGQAYTEGGWTISLNFKLYSDASTTSRHALIGSHYVDTNGTYDPHNIFLEYNTGTSNFDIKGGRVGSYYTIGSVDAGEDVNLTFTRDTGAGSLIYFINGVNANISPDASNIGREGKIAVATTDANDFFGLEAYPVSSINDQTSDFIAAESINSGDSPLYKTSYSDQLMVGIQIDRTTGHTYNFEGEISSIVSMDRSLTTGQVEQLFDSTGITVPETAQSPLIVGLILLTYFSTRRRNFIKK